MRDDDDRHASAEDHLVDGSLDQMLAFRIKSGGRLVQQQNLWLSDQRPCNGDSLFLSSAHLYPSFPNLRLVLIGKRDDEIMGIRQDSSRHDFFLRRLCQSTFQAIQNIFSNGPSKQNRILAHDAHDFVVPFVIVFFDRHAIQKNFSFVRVVEVFQQGDAARFPPSAGPHQGKKLPRRYLDRHPFQNFLQRPTGIREVNIFQANFSLDRRWDDGEQGPSFLGLSVDPLVNLVRCPNGFDHRTENRAHAIERVVQSG
mmetsp:Transcript_2886/g.4348  ORF Transcript_2886/g.4348 Transcript_2886/m.4348 type:complete len:255 (-) Transcript_2886:1088-1852(-)